MVPLSSCGVQRGVGIGALGGCSAFTPPPHHAPEGSQDMPGESTGWLAAPHFVSFWCPTACSLSLQSPIPFLLCWCHVFQMKSEHDKAIQRHSGGSRQTPGRPTPPTLSLGWLLRPPAQAHLILQALLQLSPPPGSPPTLIMLLTHSASGWRTETKSIVQ